MQKIYTNPIRLTMKRNNLSVCLFAIVLFVGCASEYANKAIRAEEAGDYVSAIELWNEHLERRPDDIIAYIDRGVDKSLTGDYKGAIDDYSSVIERDSTHILAWVNRGKNRYRIDDYAAAIADYDTAIDLKGTVIGGGANYMDNSLDLRDVRYVEIVFERGLAYYELDSLDRAFKDFEYCVTQKYLPEKSHYFRGMIYAISGRKMDAMDDFKAVIRYGSTLPDEEYTTEAAKQLKTLEIFFQTNKDEK